MEKQPQLKALVEDCRAYLDLVREAFATDNRPVKTMHAFRILTRKIDGGDIDELLINLDVLLD